MQHVLNLFRLHLRYHLWATKRMWEVIDQLTPEDLDSQRRTSFGSIRLTLEHMYKADCLWLSRLRGCGDIQLCSIEAPAAVSGLKQAWFCELDQINSSLDSLGSDAFRATRSFVNSKGEAFAMPIWQIFLQIVNHGTGHRGQINALLRESGKTPLGTDLVQFYRSLASQE